MDPPSHRTESKIDDLEDLEHRIQDGLVALMKQSTQQENSRIILEQDLKDFWMQDGYDKFYKKREWYGQNEVYNKFVFDNLLKILSILILLNFRRWDQFKRLFMDTASRTDCYLPFERSDLQKSEWLGSRDGDEFFNKQWTFCPLVILEREKPYQAPELRIEQRLPFIEEREPIGAGASAEVYREVIAPHHLQYSTPKDSINKIAKAVACKVVPDKKVDYMEFKNLESLRQCLSSHSRIMVNIATFIRHEAAGTIHHILYDLAAFSLEHLLSGKADLTGEERHKSRKESAPQGRNWSHEHWAGDFIQESHHLADALTFLHHGLYNAEPMRCAHNDLKPENILVFYPDSTDVEKRYPVGQWKIADFGISKIKQMDTKKSHPGSAAENKASTKGNRNTLSPLPDMYHDLTASRTPSKREPGKYTGPEIVTVGQLQPDARKGDIWSFACILAEILAYAVKPDLVKELRTECMKPAEGRNSRFYDVSTRLVKPHVTLWLQTLSKRHSPTTPESNEWVDGCAGIIVHIFNHDDPLKRPEATHIRDELQKVYAAMKLKRERKLRSDPDMLEQEPAMDNGLGIIVTAPDGTPSGTSNISQSPELMNGPLGKYKN